MEGNFRNGLQQLLLFGLIGFTDITLAHATERGVGVNSGVVPITPICASAQFNVADLGRNGF